MGAGAPGAEWREKQVLCVNGAGGQAELVHNPEIGTEIYVNVQLFFK